MGLRVNNNIAALNAYRNLSVTDGQMSKSLEKLSSGFRINRAADDAAGLAISEGLRSQIGGLKVAVRNTQDGISVVQTAEGALTETHSILQRMRDLSVQAANDGGLNTEAKKNIQSEITQLKAEINRISDTTTFNGKKLLDGTFSAAFQVGANKGETITLAVGSVGAGMDTTGLGVNGVDVTTASALTVTQVGAIADDQGTPTAGTNVITGDFSQAATFDTLKGTIAANGKTFDLSSVKYLTSDTAAQRLTKLNAAAQTALGTVSGTPFTVQTTVSITFTGDTPAVGSTAAQAAKASPVSMKACTPECTE